MTSLSTRNITIANDSSSLDQINAIANSNLARDNSKISKKVMKKLKKEILQELKRLKSGKALSKKDWVALFNKLTKNVNTFINGCKQSIDINKYPNLCSDLEHFQSTIKNLVNDIASGDKSAVSETEKKMNALQKKIGKDSNPPSGHHDDADIGKLLCQLNEVISKYTKGLVEIVQDISQISSKIFKINCISANASGMAEHLKGTGMMWGGLIAVAASGASVGAICKTSTYGARIGKVADSVKKIENTEGIGEGLNASAEQQQPAMTVDGIPESASGAPVAGARGPAIDEDAAADREPEVVATNQGPNPPKNEPGQVDAKVEVDSATRAARTDAQKKAGEDKARAELEAKKDKWGRIHQTIMGIGQSVPMLTQGIYEMSAGQEVAKSGKASAQGKFTETVETQAKTIVQNISSGVETIARTMEASNGLFIARGRAGAA